MLLHVLKPLFYVDELNDNEIVITGFIDEEDNELTVEDLLNVEKPTKYYCYGFQPTIAYIEKWWKQNKYKVCKFKGKIGYHGHTANGTLLCYDHVKVNHNSAPTTLTFKAYYFGHEVHFLDLDKWIDRLSLFHEEPGERKEIFAVLHNIEKLIMPGYEKSFNAAKAPGALAKVSRAIITDLGKFKSEERNDFLHEVRSCNSSGYNYIAEPNKVYTEPLYYYDVKSMYPFMVLNKMYPKTNRPPKRYEGFKNTNGLAIYHINSLVAVLKPRHFPTLFSQQEQQQRMGLPDNININWQAGYDTINGWITSIDLQMLYRDYDVSELDIDISYCYQAQEIGRDIFGNKLQVYFDRKEAATDRYERQAYKGLINKFVGSLSMKQGRNHYKVDDLSNPTRTEAIPASEDNLSPLDLGAFTTAYARQYITGLALLAGYENVACISTDAIVIKNPSPIQKYVGNKMGDLSLDRVMHNTKWWRINTYEWQDEDGNWKAKIAGLPSYKYQHDKTFFVIPKMGYDIGTNQYYKFYQTFNLEEDYLCQNEIDYTLVGIEL